MAKLYGYLGFVLLCCACGGDNRPTPDQAEAFIKYYGHTGSQTGMDIFPIGDGEGWLLLGSMGLIGDREAFYLVGVDEEGKEKEGWSVTSDKPHQSEGTSLHVNNDGDVIIIGNTGTDTQASKIFVAKIRLSDGMAEMQDFQILREGKASNEWAGKIRPLDGGGYIVVGTTDDVDKGKHNYDEGTDVSDLYITRLNDDFSPVWERINGFPYRDFAKGVKELGEGDYMVTGSSYDSPSTARFIMARYNGDGGILEYQKYGGSGRQLVYADGKLGRDRSILFGWDDRTGSPVVQILDDARRPQGGLAVLPPLNHPIVRMEGIADIEGDPDAFLISGTVGKEGDTNIFMAKIILDGQGGASEDWHREFGGSGMDAAGDLLDIGSGDGIIMVGTMDITTNTMMTLIRTNGKGELLP